MTMLRMSSTTWEIVNSRNGTIFSETVKEKGSEHCGVTTGGKSMQKRETWWWNTTVQEAIAKKKRMFKKWQQSKAQEDHAVYKADKERS